MIFSPLKKLENLINQEADCRSASVNYFFYYLSKIYNFISSSKYYLYNYKILRKSKFSEITISVGNMTIGGTGKTPFVINLSEKLLSTSIKPLIINKDYGVIDSKIAKIVSDGHDIYKYPPKVSDEAYLTAISLLSNKGKEFFGEMNYYLPEGEKNIFFKA
jgi:tetraacyldisaccharide 4'-kinase